ncbi:MAG: DUF2784 domain-containing protein [Pseudomonadota bacterium]
MFYGLFADIVVVVHFAFVLFSVFGGFLVLRWRRCAWIQVPVFLWAALIEFEGWICPLTPLENWFREQGGEAANQTGFIEHYILPVLYPTELTRSLQIALGVLVFVINLGVYGWVLGRSYRKRGRALSGV